jgi:Ni2+-binding GTPase involved in maturation of urease and hydrogenase
VAVADSRNAGGTKGRKTPVEMSPNTSTPATVLVVMKSDLLSHILLQSVQVSWAAANAT